METEVWLLGPLTNDKPVQETWNLASPVLRIGFWECWSYLEEIRIAAAGPQHQTLAQALFADLGFVEHDEPTDKQRLYQNGDRCFISPLKGERTTFYLQPPALSDPHQTHRHPEPQPQRNGDDHGHQRPLPRDGQGFTAPMIKTNIPANLRQEFAASFEGIEDFKKSGATLIAQQWHAILTWLEARGCHDQFRFGRSMFSVIISRSREHGLRPDQDSICIQIHRNGAVDLFYTGSIKKKIYTEPENLFAGLEELLTILAQQPIN